MSFVVEVEKSWEGTFEKETPRDFPTLKEAKEYADDVPRPDPPYNQLIVISKDGKIVDRHWHRAARGEDEKIEWKPPRVIKGEC